MKKQIATLLLTALTITMAAGCGNNEKGTEGTPAVKVNGDVITQEEIDSNYDRFCTAYNLENQLDERSGLQFKRDVTTYLIENELILQEAKKRDIEADQEQVSALKEQFKGYYNSEDEFKTALSEQKMTEEQFDDMLKEQVIYNALQENLLQEVDIDAQAYYEAHRDEFAVGERVKASHILVETEDEAKAIIAQLDEGADFAQLAQDKSTDTGSKGNGGDLGYFTRERMVTEFSDAAFNQEVGTYSKTPVKSDFGYHIIYVEDKKPAGVMDFAEVEQSIKSRLTNTEFNKRFAEMLDQLKSEAKIEYINTDLDPDSPLPEITDSTDGAEGEPSSADGDNTDAPADEDQADGENTPAE